MSNQILTPDTRVTWQFGEHRAVASLTLTPGKIYVLHEDEGNSCDLFREALRGRSINGFSVKTGDSPLNTHSVGAVTAEEKLVSNLSVPAYLEKIGVPTDAIPTVMTNYELGKLSYLTCSQLPAMAARQLELLTLLRSASEIWVLDDPFQPFNGRWREDFAQQILDQVLERQLLVVVTRLSFIPQCWQTRPEFQPVSIDQLCAEALQKVHRMIITEVNERKSPAPRESQKPNNPAPPSSQVGSQLLVDGKVELPPSLLEKFAYRPVRDWIFEPMGRIGSSAKNMSGALGIGAVAALILMAIVVFLPALQTGSRLNLSFWGAPVQAMQISKTHTTSTRTAKDQTLAAEEDQPDSADAIVAVTDSGSTSAPDPKPEDEVEPTKLSGELEPELSSIPPQMTLALSLPAVERVSYSLPE